MKKEIVSESLKKSYYEYSKRKFFEAIKITMIIVTALVVGVIANHNLKEPLPFWLMGFLTVITSIPWIEATRIKRLIDIEKFPTNESDVKKFLIFLTENKQEELDDFNMYIVITWFSIGVAVTLVSYILLHNYYGAIIGALIMLSSPAIMLYRGIKLKQRKAVK